MLLTYVDESYTKDRFDLAALMVPSSQAVSLSRALDAVVEKAQNSYGEIKSDAELHGYDILHGKKDWESIALMVRARIGVYGDALDAVAAHDVRIVLRGVDSKRLRAPYSMPDSPHSIALTHLLERVDEEAAAMGQYALVIADEVGDEQSQFRKDLRFYQDSGTWGYRSRKITQIVDTIHFAPSRVSRLVQAADLLAYLHHRRQVQDVRSTRAIEANNRLWQKVAPKVCHEGCWVP